MSKHHITVSFDHVEIPLYADGRIYYMKTTDNTEIIGSFQEKRGELLLFKDNAGITKAVTQEEISTLCEKKPEYAKPEEILLALMKYDVL